MEELIELKKLAEKIYEMYTFLISFLEKGDKKSVFELSKKIDECKLKEEEILTSLDENTIIDLFNFALNNIDNDNPAYIYKLYLFVIDYFNTNYSYLYNTNWFDEEEDNVNYAKAYAYAYSYKKMFDVLQNDTLGLKNVDNNFFEGMKHKIYQYFLADAMQCPEFEEVLLTVNFDLNSLIYSSCAGKNVKKEVINLILYAERLNNIVFNEDNTLKTLKCKYMFEYLINNLNIGDFLEIKDYLYLSKKDNFMIAEFKKVIEERGKAYGR